MAAPYNNLLSKAASSVKLWLATQSIGTSNLYVGKRSLVKEAPCVVVHARKGVEYPLGSGNQRVTVDVWVKSTLGDENESETAHDTLTAKTFDALSVYDPTNPNYFAEQLSALVADFTVFGTSLDVPKEDEAGPSEENSDAWMDKKTLVLYCCASDIS